MKKNFNNKKIILYVVFFIIFLFLPLLKIHAAPVYMGVSVSAPTTVVSQQKYTFEVAMTSPFFDPVADAADLATDSTWDIFNQPVCDGVPVTVNGKASGGYLVSSVSKVNTTLNLPAPYKKTVIVTLTSSVCPLSPKNMTIIFYEVNNAGVNYHTYYTTPPIALTAISADQGYYYTYNYYNTGDAYYSYGVSQKFTDLNSCLANQNDFTTQHIGTNYKVWEPCSLLGGKPIITGPNYQNNPVPTPISGTKVPYDGTYTLLAPIPGLGKTAPTNFGDYVNKIFLLIIGLCGALAVIMIVIGGIQYMGDESIFGKTEAKSQITRAILGLLIALGSYALLNTINPNLLKSSVSIKAVSAEIVPLYDRGANDPKNPNGESIRCTPVTSGPCSVANLTTALGVDTTTATAMSKICNMESGGTSIASGTDYCSPPGKSLPFSFGLFQVNLAANGSLASTDGLDCSNLFDRKVSSKDAIAPKYTSGFTCSLLPGKETLYNTCKNRILDPATNLAIAKSLLAASQNKSPWIGDKKYCASAFN